VTLWGGRFKDSLAPDAFQFNASLAVDQRLALQDIAGSLAWAFALGQAGVIDTHEASQIHSGLETIQEEFTAGTFVFAANDEDIHTAVERRLKELIGPVAGKLHTGRSRNDQVVTDFRRWMLDFLPLLDSALIQLQQTLVRLAEEAGEALMPGYTHLQQAQPILLAHWWLSHFWPLQRDRQRLSQLGERTAILPLGCGALAGTPIAIDRHHLAATLGFRAPAANSLDAVADRDFAVEFLFWAALTAVHLSKLSEAVILFSSVEFGFFELPDTYATGSSLMPQKKNPDVFELARGKTGTLIGRLCGLLATLKGLPSTYDKDLQEDKAAVFEAADTLRLALPVLSGALSGIKAKSSRMRMAIRAGMMATDLADYLVAKGLPFRETHELAGKAVQVAQEQGLELDQLPLEALRTIHPIFDESVYLIFDPMHSVERRQAYGGTAPVAVRQQLAEAQNALANSSTLD
jgi:argininosuccinate lyase